MTQGDRERIRRVRLGRSGKGKQGLHHVLNLSLVGTARANHGLLDLTGGVLVNGQAAGGGTDNGRAPGLPQLEGGRFDDNWKIRYRRPSLQNQWSQWQDEHCQCQG